MTMTAPASRGFSGFTLIEVLVAMVVMAIMSLMAWQGVDGIVRSRDANQTRLEQALRLQTVIAQWEQDLANLQESTAAPTLQCDGKTVRLTRRADNGVQLVAWSLQPDATGSTWQRWASPAVTTKTALQEYWLRALQFQGSEPGQLRAIPGLDQWQVYFYVGNAWSNCQSTGNLAPATGAGGTAQQQRQALPSGVRVVLGFAPGSGLSGNLTRDTLIQP